MRKHTGGITGIVLLLVITGCADNSKNYRVPTTMCDVSIKSSALGKILPPGDKLTVAGSRARVIPDSLFCSVDIDGKTELSTEGRWQKGNVTAKQAAEQKFFFNTKSAQGGRYAVWDDGATTVIDCKNASQKAETFSIEAHVVHSDGDVGDKVVSFLASLADGYKKTLPCER